MRTFCLVFFFTCLSLQPAFSADMAGERFRQTANGTIVDSKSGLVWAAKDNGEDINWHDAEKYCQTFNPGDGKKWRMPYQEELATLYDLEAKKDNDYGISKKIKISSCCMWAYDESVNAAGIFSFKTGKEPWGFKKDTGQLRVLPVRKLEIGENLP